MWLDYQCGILIFLWDVTNLVRNKSHLYILCIALNLSESILVTFLYDEIAFSKSSFLSGKQDQAVEAIQVMLDHSRDNVIYAETLIMQGVQLQTIGKHEESLDLFLKAAERLGMKISKNPSTMTLAKEFITTKIALIGKN